MNKPTKLLMIAGSTTAIVFFSYKLYKTYLSVKEELEHDKIDNYIQEELEAVQATESVLEERKDTFAYYEKDTVKTPDTTLVDYTQYFEDEEDEENDENEKGVEKLRYPSSSYEALEQWRAMKLADIHTVGTVQLIIELYNHKFEPSCEQDLNLAKRISDDKMMFFGSDSTWIDLDQVTVGDIIIHYSELLSFDLGHDINQHASMLSNNFLVGLDMCGNNMENAVKCFALHTLIVNSAGEEGIFSVYRGGEMTSFQKDYFEFIEQAVS